MGCIYHPDLLERACELLTTGEGRAHASTAPASGGLATGGDSTLGLQASRAAKCLEEEAALGPKYRLGMEKVRGHEKDLEPGSLPTADHRHASAGGTGGQETGSSKVEQRTTGPNRRDGEKRGQARAGQGRAGLYLHRGGRFILP